MGFTDKIGLRFRGVLLFRRNRQLKLHHSDFHIHIKAHQAFFLLAESDYVSQATVFNGL